MKLKLENGAAVLKDGMPVYVKEDGTETEVNVAAMYNSVREYKAEAKARAAELKELTDKLAKFDGLDPDRIRKGLADQDEIAKRFEAQVTAERTQREAVESKLNSKLVEIAFKGSKFMSDRVAVPWDMVAAMFGRHFKVEGDQVIATGHDGSPIYSRQNPAQKASFDEALEILMSAYPHKDSILKADQKPGSGAPSSGNPKPGAKTMPEAQFNSLSPKEQAAVMAEGVQLTT